MTVMKPMKHQLVSLKLADKSNVMFDMSCPGTGKTYVQVMAFAKRRKKNGGCALVIAPRSLLRSAWEDDFRKFAPFLTCSVATADNREKAFAANADVYITNTDATTWLLKQKPAFFKRFDTIIVDEVSSFKHNTSQRSKALLKIRKHFKYRAALSGTPNSNTICDIHTPMVFLDDGHRLGNNFFAFRSSVCQPNQVGPRAEMVKWEDKPGAEEAVYGLINDIVVRHRFEDCIDIPETHRYCKNYYLTTKQKKAYLEMEKTQVAMLSKLKVVTAINKAAVRTKLLQIASGAVYESPDNYHLVDTERYELVMDMVEERKQPLVFFLWKHQRDELVKLAEKRGLRYCVMDGNASDKERQEMVAAYQKGFYDVMFAHPKSAAHGLTLTKGTSTIWPSPTDDLEWFNQGNKRQARNGQTEKTEIVVIVAEGTIEEKVYTNLMNKDGRMNNLLDLFAEAA